MRHLITYNESIRDRMTPVPKEDIKNKIGHLSNVRLFMYMWKALWSEDIDTLREFISFGADINVSDVDRNTLLHIACIRRPIMVDILLSLGIDPNKTNKEGYTPIFIATKNRNIDAVKLILNSENFKPFEFGQIYTCIELVKNRYDNESKELYKMLLDYELNQPFNESLRDKMTARPKEDTKELLESILRRLAYELSSTTMRQWTKMVSYDMAYKYVKSHESFVEQWVADFGYESNKIEALAKEMITYFGRVVNESLQDGLTMKPIEHITSVGTFHRYNFIEDWANHEKYGKDVGYIVIDNECDLFLSSFTIWEPYKGKGLGRKYLNIILDELKKFSEYPWVALSVKKDNEIAINLYKSVGFRNVNDVDEYEGPGKNYKNKAYYYLIKENK